MIEIKNITKSFGDLMVLKGVNFHINKGEIVSIVGASGAGKTTLLQIIGTLLEADGGTLRINDIEINNLKNKQLARFRNQNIGFVFQFHNLLPEFTAIENVCIPAFIAKESEKQAIARAEKVIGFLKMTERKNHKPAELSGGEQQRVAVARALINNPQIILADEPSGNLDTKNKEELHKLFFDLRKKFNQTIVIVTHDKELAAMSDRIIQISDGIVKI
ncbi:MAG: ABC transporter ATP-binding protein [Bacteroidetes bacterium]|jgi:lipoprotein-releasing system ATP-binding protein|nr:ABC transporter ATP-binding protein [Bacteroidota bacterium]MBT6687716.1 ABC transporter ATP-binding protein [Bacteroidota bacterium]MBT7143690.1 ABC transporter ATP-binding protein [Bacteroidota bacterium]MBT7493296.1 ABC transporter ATP-binding protein [Bacteroidota bacterium]